MLENPYYGHKSCEGIELYELCKSKVSRIVDEEEFLELTDRFSNLYEPDKPKSNLTMYLAFASSFIIITVGTIIILKKKKKNKKRR